MREMKTGNKFAFGLIFSNLYRLLKVFPNNDPLMGFALPFARKGKWWHAMIFPIVAMVSFDFISGAVGIWTVGTSLTYGLVGFLFYKYCKGKKKIGLKTYAGASVLGVLFFDFITGAVMSPFMFGMTFEAAFIGQIPFTAMHLFSATFYTLLLAPVLDPEIAVDVSTHVSAFTRRVRAAFGMPEAI
ncbi:MAG: hypothetical protein NT067_00955 [Candidatus Diapherotrites archaeon]|nr:hypothetical protein [Candidatus Diapherotrites archaeon]